MNNGVPYDVAMTLPLVDVAAQAIIFSEFAGNQFDWNAFRFVEKP